MWTSVFVFVMTSKFSSPPSPVALLSLNFGDESDEFPLLSPLANLNYFNKINLYEKNEIRKKSESKYLINHELLF